EPRRPPRRGSRRRTTCGVARGRARRPFGAAQDPALQVALRRGRGPAVRGHHPAAGVLPDADRDRHPPGTSAGHRGGGGAGRDRHRARPRRRRKGRAAAVPPPGADRLRAGGDRARVAGGGRRPRVGGGARPPGDARGGGFHPELRPARGRAAGPAPRLLPRLHHRQLRSDGRRGPPPPHPGSPRPRRPPAARRRPGEGPGGSGSRLRRRGRRHRGVQPEPAAPPEPRVGRRLRRVGLPPSRRVERGGGAGGDAPGGHPRAAGPPREQGTPVPGGRDHPHGKQPQVPAGAPGGPGRRRGMARAGDVDGPRPPVLRVAAGSAL
ncbi:MAG: hypothetical protein AVDCRST_MAG04-1962, partial [uncultured Acetobacteraceae bacterium]